MLINWDWHRIRCFCVCRVFSWWKITSILYPNTQYFHHDEKREKTCSALDKLLIAIIVLNSTAPQHCNFQVFTCLLFTVHRAKFSSKLHHNSAIFWRRILRWKNVLDKNIFMSKTATSDTQFHSTIFANKNQTRKMIDTEKWVLWLQKPNIHFVFFLARFFFVTVCMCSFSGCKIVISPICFFVVAVIVLNYFPRH